MFTPNLDLIVTRRATVFRIEDKTGQDTGAGDKWDGVSGLDSSTLTAATITIITPSGVSSEVDVLSQIPSPVTGSFYFNDILYSDGWEDKLYTLIYELKINNVNITAFADYSGTVAGTTKVTAAGHNLSTGMYVDVTGTTNYNGEYYATPIDSSNFYITKTYVANDATGVITRKYKNWFYPYVWANADAGINTMYANISRMVPGPDRDDYLADANTCKGLLRSLQSAITSSNVSALDDIHDEIMQTLSYRGVEVNI